MRISAVSTVVSYFFLAASAAPTQRSPPTSTAPVVTDTGLNVTYHGTGIDSVESFLNIRFAEDTSGENRFAAPKPFTYADGTIVNASAPGAACPQQKVPVQGFSVFSNVTNVSEDCLTLRVDRPANTTADAKLPVLLWIYGGGDTIGQIYDQTYDPTGLILGSMLQDKPVIYAAVNYRLGFFGWSSFPDNNSTAVSNAGLLDQRMGMEWIQKNVALFGGDPENITIFGESDGGTAVGLQVTAYGGEKPVPFKRAIMESGSAAADQDTVGTTVCNRTVKLTGILNCNGSHVDTAQSVACLRNLTLQQILPTEINYTESVDIFSGFDVFHPVVDGSFVPAAPSTLLKTGRFARNVSVIIGWNTDDGSLFTATPDQVSNATALQAYITQSLNLTDSQYQEAVALYPTNSSLISAGIAANPSIPKEWFVANQISRDTGFTCVGILQAQSMANYSSPETGVYLYQLNATLFAPALAAANQSFYGITHFSDIPYVLNQAVAYNASAKQVALSSQVSGSWVDFAYGKGPAAGSGNSSLPDWPNAFTSSGKGVDLDDFAIRIIGPGGAVVQAGTNLNAAEDFEDLGKRCAFWNSPDLLAALGV